MGLDAGLVPRGPRGRCGRLPVFGATTVVVVALALAAAAAPAGAHALRVSSSPDAGAVLQTAPSVVTVTFGEPPDPHLSRLRVLDSAGHDETTGSDRDRPWPGAVASGPCRHARSRRLHRGLDDGVGRRRSPGQRHVRLRGSSRTERRRGDDGDDPHVVGTAVHPRGSVAALRRLDAARRSGCDRPGLLRATAPAELARPVGRGVVHGRRRCAHDRDGRGVGRPRGHRPALELVVPHAARIPAGSTARRRPAVDRSVRCGGRAGRWPCSGSPAWWRCGAMST